MEEIKNNGGNKETQVSVEEFRRAMEELKNGIKNWKTTNEVEIKSCNYNETELGNLFAELEGRQEREVSKTTIAKKIMKTIVVITSAVDQSKKISEISKKGLSEKEEKKIQGILDYLNTFSCLLKTSLTNVLDGNNGLNLDSEEFNKFIEEIEKLYSISFSVVKL